METPPNFDISTLAPFRRKLEGVFNMSRDMSLSLAARHAAEGELKRLKVAYVRAVLKHSHKTPEQNLES
jgi:hypothetical protein